MPVKAESGRELPEAEVVLSEAWAVLAETDDVGGPDTKIERGGGLTWCRRWVGSEAEAEASRSADVEIVLLRGGPWGLGVVLLDVTFEDNGKGGREA